MFSLVGMENPTTIVRSQTTIGAVPFKDSSKLLQTPKDGPTYLFRNGFGSYLQSGYFSDLLLIHSKKEYNVHQVYYSFFYL